MMKFKILRMKRNAKAGAFKMPFVAGILFMVLSCNQGGTESRDQLKKEKAEKPDQQPKPAEPKKNIVFFGNSLTAGYGVDPSEAFPAVIGRIIDSLGLPYQVVNAGVSGETSTGGDTRVNWVLKQPVSVFVLELGANDGLRGIPVAQTKKSLQSIIAKVRNKYPEAKLVLAGMQVPPNMGPSYSREFRTVYPELAEKNGMLLIPFLLEEVGGEKSLNQNDGIHPTVEGHKIVANTVWKKISGLLE
jgi:acyl-CoA thioesterase-1